MQLQMQLHRFGSRPHVCIQTTWTDAVKSARLFSSGFFFILFVNLWGFPPQLGADRLLAVGQKQHPCITRTVCFIIKYHLSLHLNLFLTSVLSGFNKALKTNSQLSQLTELDVYIYYL